MSAEEPYRSHRFAVEVEGLGSVGVSEVRGLAARVTLAPPAAVEADVDPGELIDLDDWPDAVDWDAVGEWHPPVSQRGTESPSLELTRGVTDDRTLYGWLADWVDGRTGTREVRVYLLDGTDTPARGWRCPAAAPVRWTGPDLVADRSGVATETLELAHGGVEPLSPDGG